MHDLKNLSPFQANQTPNEFHYNVDVQEFYPRFQIPRTEPTTKVNCDAPSVDLERKGSVSSPKPKVEAPKVTKPSHTAKPNAGRVSKKEIIEGIKSMEQQNIDLMASKRQTLTNATHDDEWNVIKKGKKVKVVKDIKMELTSSDVPDAKKDKTDEIKIEQPKVEVVPVPEPIKKSIPAPIKSKKSKSKNKKKKSHLAVKQDGFEIIEPEFNNTPADEEASPEMSEEEVEEEIPEVAAVLNAVETNIELIVAVEQEVVAKKIEQVAQAPETVAPLKVVETKTPEVNDLSNVVKKIDDDDDVIDISDEDICCKINVPLELASIQEVERVVKMVNMKLELQAKKPEVVEKKAEVAEKKPVVVEKKPEVLEQKPEVIEKKPEVVEKKPEDQAQLVQAKPEVKSTLAEVDTNKPLVKAKTPEVEIKPEMQVKKSETKAKKEVDLKLLDPFQDKDYFSDRTNIAALERDLMENLRLLDDDIDLKSPIINPLHDFPITSAVQKWLQAKQNESFDSLFHVQNFQKLSELFDDDEDDETESDISEKELKSETDSDYASDFHAKANGGSPTCSTHAKGSSKCNKLIAKESFCALM